MAAMSAVRPCRSSCASTKVRRASETLILHQALELAKPCLIQCDNYYQIDSRSCSVRAPAAPAHVQSRNVDERARSSERAV